MNRIAIATCMSVALGCLASGQERADKNAVSVIRIVDRDFAPVAGAELILVALDGKEVARQTSDGRGRIVLPRLGPGAYRVTCTKDGYFGVGINRQARTPEGSGGSTRFIDDRTTADLHIDKALLTAMDESKDAEPEDPKLLQFTPGLRVILLPDQRVRHSVGSFEGRVVDPAGNGVKGARLSWRMMERWSGRMSPRSSAFQGGTTGNDGGFSLGSRSLLTDPGYVEVTATHPDWAYARKIVQIRADVPNTRVELILAGPATVQGRLRGPSGEPIAYGRVEAVPAGGEAAPVTLLRAGAFDEYGRRRVGADTDREGRFRLTGLSSGAVHLVARSPGYTETLRRDVTVKAGTSVDVDLTLGPGAQITARFIGPEGRPATVDGFVTCTGDASLVRLGRKLAGAREVSLDGLDSESFRLLFSLDGYAPVRRQCKGGATLTIDLVPACRIEARVTLPKGAAALGELNAAYVISNHAERFQRVKGPGGVPAFQRSCSGHTVAAAVAANDSGKQVIRVEGLPPTADGVVLRASGYQEVLLHGLKLSPEQPTRTTVTFVSEEESTRGATEPEPVDVPGVIARLESAAPEQRRALMSRIRRIACTSVGHPPRSASKRTDLIPVAVAGLANSDSGVRTQAICTLAYMKNRQALPALIAALDHSDSTVRYYAVMGLPWLGNLPDLRDEVVGALKRVRDNDAERSFNTRLSAAESLIVDLHASKDMTLIFEGLRRTAANGVLATSAVVALGRRDAVELLIGRLVSEPTEHYADALAELTGARLGLDHLRWRRWLDAHRDELPQQVR